MRCLLLLIIISYNITYGMTVQQFQQKFTLLSEKAATYNLWDKYPSPADVPAEFVLILMNIQQFQIKSLEIDIENLKKQNQQLQKDITDLKKNPNISENYSSKVIKQLTPSFDTFFFGCLFSFLIYCSYKVFDMAKLEMLENKK